jgi:hypothetical protein
MTKLQFRILYRQFLFRIVDLELLSSHAQGDASRLLGQFAALLIFLGILFSIGVLGVGNIHKPRLEILVRAWGLEHSAIATTMLVAGLFAIVSWDATFPTRNDIFVLAPLPVRARTLFLAKVAASATALSLATAALNGSMSLLWPLVLSPETSGGILQLVLTPEIYRTFGAYCITVLAAAAFMFGSLLCLQGLATQLLPRRLYLRASALLQIAAFGLLISVYFLQPSFSTPAALANPANQASLAWLPSYWFLGLFQELNGSLHPAMVPLMRRAWSALAIVVCGTAVAYVLAYVRTLRKIVEEPDIAPGSRAAWLPRFGDSLETAVVQFSIRTLSRSRQHRVMLAFFLGIGFSLVIALLKAPAQQHRGADASMIFASITFMLLTVVGVRVVFSMPLELRANWIFRVTQVRGVQEYLAAIRRALLVMAVVPVWAGSAALLSWLWPWRQAAQHMAVLGLLGIALAYLCLHGFQKIPFTCSYLPGKSYLHMAFLTAMGLTLLVGRGAELEMYVLRHDGSLAKLLIVLGIAAFVARWRTVARAKEEDAVVQFEEVPTPAIQVLGLNRDGVVPT